MDRIKDISEKARKKFDETVNVIANIATVEKLSPDDLQEIFEIGREVFNTKKRIRAASNEPITNGKIKG